MQVWMQVRTVLGLGNGVVQVGRSGRNGGSEGSFWVGGGGGGSGCRLDRNYTTGWVGKTRTKREL